jgi:hypothetical protein
LFQPPLAAPFSPSLRSSQNAAGKSGSSIAPFHPRRIDSVFDADDCRGWHHGRSRSRNPVSLYPPKHPIISTLLPGAPHKPATWVEPDSNHFNARSDAGFELCPRLSLERRDRAEVLDIRQGR